MVEQKSSSSQSAGTPRPDFETQINQLKKEVASVAETVAGTASNQLHRAEDAARQTAGEAVSSVERRVRRDPMTAIAIAAGIGLVLGALISR